MLFDDKSKGIAQAYLSMLEEAKKKEGPKMDPVGKEDDDVDNDGDSDSSDAYLKKRRAAISKSVKEDKVDEASCGTGMKSKKEAIEITIGGKSEVSKKGMKDKEGGDEEEDDEKDDMDDDEVEVKTKKKDGGGDDKKKKEMPAFMQKKEGYKSDAQRKAVWAARNEKGIKEAKSSGAAYAIGMSKAMDTTGDDPPLEKSTIKKAHKIAKAIMKKESTVWDWDSILEASDEEIDQLIEQLDGDDLESFVSEFSQLSEMARTTKVSPNAINVEYLGGGKYKVHSVGKNFADGIKSGERLSDAELNNFKKMGGKVNLVKEQVGIDEMYPQAKPGVSAAGQEKLEPRAPAEKAFAAMHKTVEKDHPFDKDQHDKGVKSQSPARPGDKRANEPMKTLKDIRK